jgi:hypothetical protein
MIVDRTQSDKLRSGSACVAVYLRYGSASCTFNINEIACLARTAGNFSVFRTEKRIPAGEAHISVSCAPSATVQYLDEREVREIVRSVAYWVMPIVNATIVLVLVIIAAVPVYSLCLLLILHTAFKSYKMLSVHKLCQSRS